MRAALLLALCAVSMQGQDVNHPLQIGGDVSAPQLIHQADFTVPDEVMKKLHSINFDVTYIVDPEGVPRSVTIVSSNLPKAWEAKARESVEAYRFRPGRRQGVSVAVAIHSAVFIDGF